jgi:hypothetical protein
MSISSRKIRNRLKRFWPELKNIWLTDPVYLNTPKEIVDVLALWEGELRKYSFKKNLLECEEFALFCHAFVKQHQVFNYSDKYNWAYGECIATKVNGSEGVHSCNIYLTSNNIYLVEPQTGAYWEANPELDTIFFIRM